MKRSLILIFVLPVFVLAAPVPKATESEKLKQLFGTTVDPDKDCKFELDGKVLRIRMPAAPHLYDPSRNITNAPRIVRTVEGDFSAEVRIRLIHPAAQQEKVAGRAPTFLAGIMIMQDDQNFVLHSRQMRYDGEKVHVQGTHGLWQNGRQSTGGGSGGGPFSAETAVFRLTRTGGAIKPAASTVGGNWHNMPELKAGYSDKVTVSIYVASDAGVSFAAEFEEFKITPTPQAEAKPAK